MPVVFVCRALCSCSYALGEKGCVENGVTIFHVADRFASYIVSAALGGVVCEGVTCMSGSLVKSGCALFGGVFCVVYGENI